MFSTIAARAARVANKLKENRAISVVAKVQFSSTPTLEIIIVHSSSPGHMVMSGKREGFGNAYLKSMGAAIPLSPTHPSQPLQTHRQIMDIDSDKGESIVNLGQTKEPRPS
ncbi:hypothetical protein Pfo_003476 [Paulownia fortunei]|nr:hypothetical protein Pfo_003476 [Paulownia fortunei]